jgi:hypothetical protein
VHFLWSTVYANGAHVLKLLLCKKNVPLKMMMAKIPASKNRIAQQKSRALKKILKSIKKGIANRMLKGMQ